MNDFPTPREAALQAENDRLKAENQYLRVAVGDHNMTFTPIGAIEHSTYLPKLPDEYRLPRVGSVKGQLMSHGRYSVLASLSHAPPESMEVGYFADAQVMKSHADYAVNQLLPWMHEQFIQALAKALKK